MTIGILRFYTNTQSRLASAGTTENASKDAMANRLCTRSKEIGSCTCRRWWRRGFANWAFGHAGPSRSAKPNCTKKTGRWIEWRLRKIEEPRQPASSANAPEAAEAVPGSLQNHRNGNTHQAARPLDLQTAPDGTLLPVAVTGAGITAMELAMSGAAEIAQRVDTRARMRAILCSSPVKISGPSDSPCSSRPCGSEV
jgi:hypothetical protein